MRSSPCTLLAALLLVAAAAIPQAGSAARAGKGPVVIDINNPRRDLYKIAVPLPVGDAETAKLLQEVAAGDLSVSGWFKVLDPKSFVANLQAEQLGIAIADWRNVGAEAVSKAKATVSGTAVSLQYKLYELGHGEPPVLEKTYSGTATQARAFAHAWSNEVVKYFTGEDSFFTTEIAFSAPTGTGRKDIFVMDYDGANLRKITNNGSHNILPTWAPSGDKIAYTSFLRGNPDLYLATLGATARPKVLSNRPGVNMGAAFSPDGKLIAATLSKDGNSEIYMLGLDGEIQRRLTQNDFIDSSPAWSPDGGRLAFVSNRHGSPQIWTMGPMGENQARLTKVGTYNQEPAWCPKCQSPTIAFTARDEKAHFDVFTLEVGSGQLTRVTENQGSNEHPSWAPNGRAMAVASSRGGIWVVTADGKEQRQVYKGPAATPVWGPSRR